MVYAFRSPQDTSNPSLEEVSMTLLIIDQQNWVKYCSNKLCQGVKWCGVQIKTVLCLFLKGTNFLQATS